MIQTPVTCYLVRAATDIGDHSQKFVDGRLTTEGQAEAAAIGMFLEEKSITRFYCSPAIKARETAELISQAIGTKLKLDDRLQERSVGEAEGLSYQSAQRKFKNLLGSTRFHKDWKFPGGETNFEVYDRTRKFVKDLFSKLTGKQENIVIISHGLNLNYFIYILQALGFQEGMLFHFEPGSMGILTRQSGKFQLRSLGPSSMFQ